ncbi:hypothetical protein MHYP_G00231880 [Metynnis hypsauchen]
MRFGTQPGLYRILRRTAHAQSHSSGGFRSISKYIGKTKPFSKDKFSESPSGESHTCRRQRTGCRWLS